MGETGFLDLKDFIDSINNKLDFFGTPKVGILANLLINADLSFKIRSFALSSSFFYFSKSSSN